MRKTAASLNRTPNERAHNLSQFVAFMHNGVTLPYSVPSLDDLAGKLHTPKDYRSVADCSWEEAKLDAGRVPNRRGMPWQLSGWP